MLHLTCSFLIKADPFKVERIFCKSKIQCSFPSILCFCFSFNLPATPLLTSTGVGTKGSVSLGPPGSVFFPQPCRHVDCWCCGVGSVSRVRVACDTSSGCGRRAEASVHTRPLSWFFCGPGALRTRRAHLKLLFSSHLWLKLYALLLCSEEARSTEVSLQV